MKALHLLAMSAAMAALTAFPTRADAQQRPVGGGPRITFPSHANNFSWEGKHGFHGGFGGVWIVEQQVPVIVERDVAPAPPPAPPLKERGEEAPPRKPYVIGSTYASLPGSCMKLIEEGVSYYYCSGEWYRQLGGGRDARYRAVARP